MNNDKNLFRQALQRQNERAAGMKMPDDMEQRVMGSIRHKKTTRHWIYPAIATVAASILLLLIFYIGKDTTDNRQAIAQQSVEQSYLQLVPQPTVEKKKEEVLVEVTSTPKPTKKCRNAVKKQNTSAEPVLVQAEPIISAESASKPQVHDQPFYEARVSSMNAGNNGIDTKMRLYTAEIELEKSTHQRQAAYEKEMMQRGLELLLYFMTEKEDEQTPGTINTQKS